MKIYPKDDMELFAVRFLRDQEVRELETEIRALRKKIKELERLTEWLHSQLYT